jgi:hypothetical protein
MNRELQHRWHFFRAGGFDQVRIETGQDILHLDQLDRKLWVALACPTQGLEFDPKTLALLDTDHDGRIRSPEIIAAAKWTALLLKNPDDLVHSKPALPLAAINDTTPEGHTLYSSARQILINLGKDADAAGAEITPEDTADTARIFANTSFNGDGVLPADGAGDPALEAIINDIIACFGSQADRSGKPGITQERVDQFFDEAQRVEDACTHNAERLMPLGEGTPAAFELVSGLAPRVNHYFTLVGLAAYAPAAAEAIHRAQEDYPTIASTPEALAGKLNELPLARIEPGRALPLKDGINPAYQAAVGRLREEVVTPLLGEQGALSEEQWRAIEERFSVFAAVRHMAVTKLGFKRIREIVAHRTAGGVDARAAISALIAKDKALEPEANSIAEVDKLVRYHRDLFHLLNNFVGFRDFYARRGKAIFQAGTLYLDQRACDLCVRVDDPAKHALMAHLARTYLAYCDITRKGADGMEKMAIAAAYTAGDSDNLMIGRNGIFFDRLGRDWDATITKIIENPISIRQAFFSPYKRALRMIGDQLAKRAAAADAQATERIQAAAANAAVAATTGVVPPAPPPPAKAKIDVGVVAALGVALGALSTAFGYFLGWLGSVHLYLLPVYVLAIILLISLPSMLIAWFKLRQRNLGPILDANGWAVNAKAKINLPFGRSLTHTPKLPPGSRHNLVDPFAEKHTVRNWVLGMLVVAVILLGCWYFGLVERVKPHVFPESPFMLWEKTKQVEDGKAAGTEPAVVSVPAPGGAAASQNAGH